MNDTDVIKNALKKFYFGIICCLYAIIFAGSVLGVVGLYKPVYVFPIVCIGGPLVYILIFRKKDFKVTQSPIKKKSHDKVIPDTLVYLITFTLILLLILVPVIRWPESIAGDWFPWDAGKYHFPKAVEMVRSGSANDLTIAYGEYPFGYESLLSFCMLITGDASLFGWMHALIDLFFILSFWLLAERITKNTPSTLLFLITLIILSNYFFQIFNLWRVFQTEVITVGKNDLLVAASILSVLYFYPFPMFDRFEKKKITQAGMVGMLALSTKPNAAYVLAPLWILLGAVIIFDWFKDGFKLSKSIIAAYLLASIMIIPGVLWLLRNLILIKAIFSDDVLIAANWSIATNLTNPYFYRYLSKNIYLIFGIFLTMLFLGINRPNYRWYTGVYILLVLGFMFTPVSAFFLRTDVPAVINWRFGEAMLAFIFIMILAIIKDILKAVCSYQKNNFQLKYLRTSIILVIAVVIIWSQKTVLQKKNENLIVLKDQFREAVGVDGYYSAYDYVQQNIRNSVVWVENGLPYYVYGPGYSNTVSRKTSADYIVVIKTDWFGTGGMQIPNYFDPVDWENYYQIVYEDPQGIVFERL